MPLGIADNVGIGAGAHGGIERAGLGGALSPRRAIETVKELLASPQFRDGVRLFAIGAAVSFSKVVFDAVLATIKRWFIGEAVFRGRDEAYRWILLLMMTQPGFRQAPRAVEVSTRPTLLVDQGASYRGEVNENETKEAWTSVQGKESEDMEKGTSHVSPSSTDDKTAGLGVHFYPATGEKVSFTFDGVRFWASRERQLVGDESWDESIKLSYLSLSSTSLRRLIKHAKEQFQHCTRGRVSIRRVDRYGNWIEAPGIAKRSIDSVHLPMDMKGRLLDDARSFLSPETRRWYEDRGIPYRRGYLFYGQPGSGKSSLCHVLASEMERPIYVLNLSASSMDDETFNERMNEVPGGSLLLIEDVDAAFVNRSASKESKQKSNRGGISFSTLLNALDGVGAVEGRLLCLTTNHIDRLDSALIRPGRIDLRLEFRNANRQQAKELFLRWYMPRSDRSIGSGQESEGERARIQERAEQFAQQIVPDTVSVAAVQGFLLTCGKDQDRALREVGAWMAEQRSNDSAGTGQ